HQRGKKVVKASSGKTTNFAPMPWASLSRFVNRPTATARESSRFSGPSWAAAILRCLAMDEFPELTRRTVDGVSRGERAGLAARDELSRAARDLEFAALDHDAPAARDELGPARVDVSLVGRVADRVVHHRVVDAFLGLGIPDGEVGIRSDGDGALARVEAVHARVVGRPERHELVE